MQISGIQANRSCQPLSPNNSSIPAVPLRDKVPFKNATCPFSAYEALNDKYNLACDIAAKNLQTAAFWQQKYQDLKNKKPCCI